MSKWMRQFYLLFSTVENMIVLYRFKNLFYVVIKYYQSKVKEQYTRYIKLFCFRKCFEKGACFDLNKQKFEDFYRN